MFNNLGLVLDMILKFYSIVAKALKPKVKNKKKSGKLQRKVGKGMNRVRVCL